MGEARGRGGGTWPSARAGLTGLTESHERDLAELTDRYQATCAGSRSSSRRLREQREPEEPAPVAPASHLVFVHLDERYELIARDGPPPAQSTPLELPDVEEGMFVVAGRRSSPPSGRRAAVRLRPARLATLGPRPPTSVD